MDDKGTQGNLAEVTPSRPSQTSVIIFRLLLLAAIFLNAIVGLMVVNRGPTAPPLPDNTPVVPGTVVARTPTAPVAQATPGAKGTGTATAVASKPIDISGPVRGVNIPVWGPDFAVAGPAIRRTGTLNANWVSLVTHWYVDTAVPYTGSGIFREGTTNGTGDSRTASDESVGRAIDLAHQNGLGVMLKPHVDWTQGGWRFHFYFDDDAARAEWWSSYREMISATVKLAIEHNVEAICIGTELGDINKEPGSALEWLGIIRMIRDAGFTGKLTYAANWGPYNDAEFDRPGLQGVWEELDYVGVDAYFPISLEQDPTLDQLVAGWHNSISPWDPAYSQNNYAILERLSRRTGKQVLFTEIGYPATDFTGKSPGEGGSTGDNDAAQARAAEAVFTVFGDAPWWAGMFWWQDGPSYNALSIAGRPAEDVLRNHWLQNAPANGQGMDTNE